MLIVDPDVKAALAPGFQANGDAEFRHEVVRKTCGPVGVAFSEAAVDDVDVHAGSVLVEFGMGEFSALKRQDIVSAIGLIGHFRDVEEAFVLAVPG